MSELVIYSRLDGTRARWFERDRQGRLGAAPRNGLPPAAGGKRSRTCTWVIQAEDLLLEQVQLAVRKSAELRQALPYALEEALAQDVEQLAFGWHRDPLGVHTLVAHREQLDAGIRRLHEAGLRPVHTLPDVLLLPQQQHGWTVLGGDGRALVRCSRYTGFACELENLEWSLSRALQQLPQDQRPQRIDTNIDGMCIEGVETVYREQSLPQQIVVGLGQPGPLELRVRAANHPLDPASRKRWYFAGALGGLALFCWIAALSWETVRVKEHNIRLQNEIETVFTRTFPGKRLQDARLQMQIELSGLRDTATGDTGILALLDAAVAVLQHDPGLKVQTISYRQSELLLDLKATGVNQLEQLRRRLQQVTGIQAEIAAIQAGGGKATAQVKLRRAG